MHVIHAASLNCPSPAVDNVNYLDLIPERVTCIKKELISCFQQRTEVELEIIVLKMLQIIIKENVIFFFKTIEMLCLQKWSEDNIFSYISN